MKLTKAIEIKGGTGEELLNTDPEEIIEAERLISEAATRIQHGRLLHNRYCLRKLPGETEN